MPNSGYSPALSIYIDTFIRQGGQLIYRHLDLGEAQLKNSMTEGLLDSAPDVMCAGATLLGLVGAAPTLGVSLGAAAAAIVIIKMGEQTVKFMQSREDHESTHVYHEEYDKACLMLLIQVRQAAFALAARYRQIIESKLDNQGIVDFAEFGVNTIVNYLLVEFKKAPHSKIPLQDLCDFLLIKANDGMLPDKKMIALKKGVMPDNLLKSNSKISAADLYARPRWALYEDINIHDDEEKKSQPFFLFMASKKEKKYFTHDDTVKELGYVVLPHVVMEKAGLILNVKKLQPIEEVDLPSLAESFLSYYLVSRAELVDYMQSIQSSSLSPQSLNEYLSRRVGSPVIAACHDERLKGLNLSGGNFNEVDFSWADLSACDLSGSQWKKAHCVGTIFSECILAKDNPKTAAISEAVNFQGAFAELSLWESLTLNGDFSLVSFKGAIFKKAFFGPKWIKNGCEWGLNDFIDMDVDDSQWDAFRQQLNDEHQLIMTHDHQIDQLMKKYEELNVLLQNPDDEHAYDEKMNAMQAELENLQSGQNFFYEKNSHFILHLQEKLKEFDENYIPKEAFISFKKDVNSLFNSQSNSVKAVSRRMSRIEQINNPLFRIINHFEATIDTLAYRAQKLNYVPLFGVIQGHEDAKPQNTMDLFEAMIVDEAHQFILLEGAKGSGKTLFSKQAHEKILQAYYNEADILSVYIQLDAISLSDNNNALSAALEKIFTKTQIDELMERYRLVIWLEGLENASTEFAEAILEDAKKISWCWSVKPKIILVAESQFLREKSFKNDEVMHLVIQPYNQKQITKVLEFYAAADADFMEKYKILKDCEQDVHRMQESPLMLHIICEVLKQRSMESMQSWTRMSFYEAFFQSWFEHIQENDPHHQLGGIKGFRYFIEQLAVLMFQSGKMWVDRICTTQEDNPQRQILEAARHANTQEESQDPFDLLFKNKILEKTRFYSPISIHILEEEPELKIRYRFTHPSFAEYSLANGLIEILKNERDLSKLLEAWNGNYLTDFSDVLGFMAEYMKKNTQSVALEARLLAMVMATKEKDQKIYDKSGSNALSLLCVLQVDLSGKNFDSIVAPKAKCCKGNFAHASFKYANLSGADFTKALLYRADFSYAVLKNAIFYQFKSQIQVDGSPKTFALFPHATHEMIAYDKKNEEKNRHEIMLMRAKDGNSFSTTLGHKTKITALSFTQHDLLYYLASGAESGNIHIWSFNDYHGKGTSLMRLRQHKGKIIDLIWTMKSRFLVSIAADQHLIIWDIERKEAIHSFKNDAGMIRAMAYGEKNNQLFAVGDDPYIRFWPLAQLHKGFADASIGFIDLERFSFPDGQNYFPLTSLALSLDNQFLALGSKQGLMFILDKDEQTIKFLNGHKKQISSLVWLDDNKLISSSYDHTVKIWDPEQGMELRTFQSSDHPIQRLACFDHQRKMVYGGGGIQDKLSIAPVTIQDEGLMDGSSIKPVSSCYQNSHLVFAYCDGSVMIWNLDPAGAHESMDLKLYENEAIQQVVISPDGQYLATQGQDKSILITRIDPTNREANLRWSLMMNQEISQMMWLQQADGLSRLIVASHDGSIYAFIPGQDENLRLILRHHLMNVKPSDLKIQYHQGQILMAVSCEEKVFIFAFDVNQEKFLLIKQLTHPNGLVQSIDWSADGQFISTKDFEFHHCIWSMTTGLMVHELKLEESNQSITWAWIGEQNALILGMADELWVYVLKTHEAQLISVQIAKLNFGATQLGTHEQNLVLVKNNGIYLIELKDLLHVGKDYNFPIKVIKADLCVDGSQFTQAEGLSSSLISFLQKSGAKFSTQQFGIFAAASQLGRKFALNLSIFRPVSKPSARSNSEEDASLTTGRSIGEMLSPKLDTARSNGLSVETVLTSRLTRRTSAMTLTHEAEQGSSSVQSTLKGGPR